MLRTSVLRISLLKDAKSPATNAEIRKLIIPPQPTISDLGLWNTEKNLVANQENSYTLLNLLYVPENAFLSKVVDYFVRLESIFSFLFFCRFFTIRIVFYLIGDISHILVWTKSAIGSNVYSNNNIECTIDSIDLPRQNLHFFTKKIDGQIQIYNSDHNGKILFYLSRAYIDFLFRNVHFKYPNKNTRFGRPRNIKRRSTRKY